MKKLNIYKTLLLAFGLLGVFACEEELGFKEPSGSDTTIPGQVSNIQVENLPGKARLTYDVPNDKSLLYVKAVYNFSSGKTREVKSSFYDNSLLLEGFADTKEHEVEVYSVSRNNIPSEPVIVTVKPKEAPIWDVFESIEMANAFGGYNLTAVNTTKEDISILILKENLLGEFEVDNQKSVYTSAEEVESKIRGLDTLDYEFKVIVQDKWGNATDTLDKIIKPIYETELDPADFTAFSLPGDAPQVGNGARLEYAWDGRMLWPYTSFTDQNAGGPDPHMITFDTGKEAKLSRIWIRAYPEFWWTASPQWYYLTTLKRFEVYGSTNPSLSGELDDSWTLLGSYEVEKPSDSPYGEDTALENQVASKGFNFEIDLEAPKVRYIRIRCLENWGGGTAQSINELKVYGDPR